MSERPPITVRRMAFPEISGQVHSWFDGNPLLMSFFCALSATFPDGERFFIDTVRHYRDELDSETMQQRVANFIGQEAHHGKSHEQLNQQLERHGLPIASISASTRGHLKLASERLSPARQLAITVALEHVTATLADHLLKNPELMQGLDPAFQQLLIWHAMEEIEHKSVAFDVFQQQVGNETLRRRVLAIILIMFFSRIAGYQFRIMRKTRHWPGPPSIWRALVFFWGPRGLMLKSLPHFLHAFKRDFHPSDIDQSALLDDWETRFAETAALRQN